MARPRRVGVLTAGGDSPGLNAAIRGFGKAAIGTYSIDLVGFRDGFRGLAEDRRVRLDKTTLSNILTVGGTILGTSRVEPLLREVLAAVAEGAGVDLRLDPQAPVVRADAGELRILLRELLANAMEAADPQAPAVQVSSCVLPAGNFLAVEIFNNGRLPQGDGAHLPFASDKAMGTGFGLPIARLAAAQAQLKQAGVAAAVPNR